MANTKKTHKTLSVSDLLAPIVSSRDIVALLEKDIKKSNAKLVDLDFSNVKFISRSAAHALLLLKEKLRAKTDISFINTNDDVMDMLRLVAANRAVSKTKKPQFEPEKIDINSLLRESLT